MEHRVLRPVDIKRISENLSNERIAYLNKIEKIVGETITFAQSAAFAIGDISIEEANQGIIDFFSDKMRGK